MGLLTLLQPAASAVWLPGSGRHWTRPRTVGPRAEDTAVSGVAHRAARRPARWPTDGNARVCPATTETRMLPGGHLAVGYLARSPSGIEPMTPGGPRRRRARRRHAGSGSDGRTPGRPGEPAPVRTGSRRLAAVRGRLRRRPVVFRPSFRPAGRRVGVPVRVTHPCHRGRASDGPRRPVVRPRLPVLTRDAGFPVPRRPSELVEYLPTESTTPHHELRLFALTAALRVADGRPGLPRARSWLAARCRRERPMIVAVTHRFDRTRVFNTGATDGSRYQFSR